MKEINNYILCTLIGIIVGFIIGRRTSDTEQTVRYVKGDTIEKTVEIPIPYKVEIPSEPIYIYKKGDTIYSSLMPEVDTIAILSDWITRRDYKQDLFDNQYGKLSIDASVEYNRLQSFKYSFTPIQKEIITRKQKTWTPYISTSYSNHNYIGAGGGIFYHDIGIGVKYSTDFNTRALDFELKYKF